MSEEKRRAPSTKEIHIDAEEREQSQASTRILGDFRPMTVDEADVALVNGLIDIQEYSRCLVAVEPLVDTLRDGDYEIRKGATFELKKRGGRNACKLLEQALDDHSEEVRLFAAEALEKLDSMYNEAINGLIERIKQKSTRRLHFLLGRLYFDYAFKGMYDQGMRTLYYEKAVKELKKALTREGDTDDWQLWQFLGSACYELGRHDEALKWFAKIKKNHGEDGDLLIKVAAVRFAQGRYDDVRMLCQRIKRKYGEGEYGEVLEFWTS